MKKHQTTAHKAEAELAEILGTEAQLYKQGALADYDVVPLRLETTYHEACLLLFEKSVVRPGFKLTAQAVDYPCLFFQVDGAIEELVKRARAWHSNNHKTTLYYSNFKMLGRAPQASAVQAAQQQGADIAQIEPLSFLSTAKKKQLAAAYKQTQQWAKSCQLSLSEAEICAACLYDNAKIIDAFHHGNAEQSNAKCFVDVVQKSTVNDYAAIRLLLMHALAFDVVVMSKDGYASIENIIDQSLFDSHTAEAKIKNDKKSNAAVWVGLLVGALLLAIYYFGVFR